VKQNWLLCILFLGPVLLAQTVKITPLGASTGEFCSLDRALLFEDPSGVRILYDPGFTVAGGDDSRLGDVHVILLSHAHGDHLGTGKLSQDPNDPTAKCDGTFAQTPAPNSNLAEIAAAKNSAVLVGAPLASVLALKIQTIRGAPTLGCPAAGLTNELVVPLSAPCTGVLNFGAKRTVTRAAGSPGVQIGAVTVQHPNDFPTVFSQTGKGKPGRERAGCLCRSRERLCSPVLHWPQSVPLGRHGSHGGEPPLERQDAQNQLRQRVRWRLSARRRRGKFRTDLSVL